MIGLTALGGAVVLIALTLLTESLTKAPSKAALESAVARNSLAEASRRNAEALIAMGMFGRMAERWGKVNRDYMSSQQRTSDVGGGLSAISKVLRMMLQSGVLAQIKTCTGKWCQVSGKDFTGWIAQERLWGAYPNEKIE